MSPHKDVPDPLAEDAVKLGSKNGRKMNMPERPSFANPHDERAYLKGRLAAAFRIFGKYGFDEGVAGHITVRVGTRLAYSFSDATNILK
jgi:hypothetical protein